MQTFVLSRESNPHLPLRHWAMIYASSRNVVTIPRVITTASLLTLVTLNVWQDTSVQFQHNSVVFQHAPSCSSMLLCVLPCSCSVLAYFCSILAFSCRCSSMLLYLSSMLLCVLACTLVFQLMHCCRDLARFRVRFRLCRHHGHHSAIESTASPAAPLAQRANLNGKTKSPEFVRCYTHTRVVCYASALVSLTPY